jgi:hypothetical protein
MMLGQQKVIKQTTPRPGVLAGQWQTCHGCRTPLNSIIVLNLAQIKNTGGFPVSFVTATSAEAFK